MRRRTFCASGLTALVSASLPYSRVFAAAGDDIAAMGLGGEQRVLKPTDIADFRANLRGQLLMPGENGYESARKVWNGAFDRKPALIARCAGAADVTRAVNFARTHELLTAVRGGGHSLSGQSVCDGGLMIDLSPMGSIRIDPLARTARVEPGVLLGQFDQEAQVFGLATTAGTISHTGAAGLTLGGGFGRLARKHGLACDNLASVDLITADGRFLRASAKDNPDLFWGLRGGGGNFGIATSFEYRLHKVGPTVFGGALIYPFTGARELLRSFADFDAHAPDELYVDVLLVTNPDHQRVAVFDVCYCGSLANAERAVAPLRSFGTPLHDGLGPAPYVELQRSGDAGNPHGRGYYVKSGYVHGITAEAIDVTVDYLESSPLDTSMIAFANLGGAISHVKPEATAYWHRAATRDVLVLGFWDDSSGAERSTQWVRGIWPKLEPLTNGFYVNTGVSDDTQRRVRAAYGDNYPRLVALKKRYDPTNLFRLNANIKPT
jgi:FAD/FMN-containing dehydrogenase